MTLAIVAYPNIDDSDRQRLESFRALHDPQAARIGVHFTLVFPFDAVPAISCRNWPTSLSQARW
jgi:hypothetical protein